MGGNLVLKMAGELAGRGAAPVARGCGSLPVAWISASCADAVACRGNFIYQEHFVRNLKKRMRRKAKLFPGKFDLGPMARVRTLREFDDVITARYCGFRDAADYYAQSSALRVAGGNSRARADRHRAGRSLRSVRELLRSRAGEQPAHPRDRSRTRRPLRIHFAPRGSRAFLGRSMPHGIFRDACIAKRERQFFRRDHRRRIGIAKRWTLLFALVFPPAPSRPNVLAKRAFPCMEIFPE